ncbi:MAG: SDR family NAD(P)-dependent oxidoreductase [Candidatus Marinimicrobia bacterium]|nr:SDR family NAD(P)-dependent oxidoreductase [Candidatus Neomarinimicrobiota bacterium]
MTKNPQKVFITGATSGIGESLAYVFSKKGAIVGISGRRKVRLEIVSEKCRDLGGNPISFVLDVKKQDECKKSAENFIEKAGGIDTVIANAGVGGSDELFSGNSDSINHILETNILGVTNTVLPFLPTMKNQQSGQIGIISSVASTRGFLGHGGYAASKSAVKFLADSWGYQLERNNISISTIFPGWIATEMTENINYKMWFLMDSDIAAEKIVNAIYNKKRSFILPWQWRLIVPVIKQIPRWMITQFSK